MDAFLDSAQRQQNIHGQVNVSQRVARLELDRPTEALFRLHPMPVACVDHPKRLVRFGQEWIQPDRLLGSRTHLQQFIGVIHKTLKRTGGVCRRQARISRRERGVFRDYLPVQTDDRLGVGSAPLRLRACVELKIIGFDTRFIPPPPAADLQAQVVHNSHRDVVLDGEDVV